VRSLEKHIEKIVRKIAYDTVSIEENLSESTNLDSIQSDIKKEKKNVKVVAEDLESYVGKPRFPQETIYDAKDAALPVGIVMGLAWNPLGGSPIFIETAAIPTALNESGMYPSFSNTDHFVLPILYFEIGGGVNMITGQLGSVMKESVNIAYTFARRFVSEL
jgi:ATP-dependent Lon protease